MSRTASFCALSPRDAFPRFNIDLPILGGKVLERNVTFTYRLDGWFYCSGISLVGRSLLVQWNSKREEVDWLLNVQECGIVDAAYIVLTNDVAL